MNPLAQILPLAHVQVNVEASSKKRAFEFAGLLFENHLGLARSVVTDNLFARERLGSTGLGQGVAIPHGRIKGLKQPSAALVRLADPVPFEAPDNLPVQLLVFLLVPEAASGKHLELLSVIAEMLSDDTFRQRMLDAPDSGALHRLVHDWTTLQHAA
jgi:PTS system nitrogen regulatory IIA component